MGLFPQKYLKNQKMSKIDEEHRRKQIEDENQYYRELIEQSESLEKELFRQILEDERGEYED